ncbi:nucleotidyltransferase family protein [Nocardioides caldifontis]|uniref:nucleotidyltransferase family protein n=1 Tax=Nocardioides caldifontis TaxID=2588938 RepID=UPI0011E06C10|nr:nucleotidyltransferase family protein [Nocardioides caldifontis]
MPAEEQENLREALKRVAVTLKRSDLPFALIGGYAVWARGGPEPEHDVDFMVADEDAGAAAALLADEGFQVVQPPEDWLFKVYTDGAMVDVIHRDSGEPATRAVVEDADEMEVLSILMPVLSGTELVVQRLNAMDEHSCDFGRQLPVARALREQVDWQRVRKETAHNDFAAAFVFLLERLSIVDVE